MSFACSAKYVPNCLMSYGSRNYGSQSTDVKGIQLCKLYPVDRTPIELAIIRVVCGAISRVEDPNNTHWVWTSKYSAPIYHFLVSK